MRCTLVNRDLDACMRNCMRLGIRRLPLPHLPFGQTLWVPLAGGPGGTPLTPDGPAGAQLHGVPRVRVRRVPDDVAARGFLKPARTATPPPNQSPPFSL